MKKEERINGFTDAIWEWYTTHKRTLPWRDLQIADDKERMYQVLVSEIMLQQTQVERVKIVFKNFLIQFPKIDTLAHAKNHEVVRAWRGMGYNSRALRLRDAAKRIAELEEVDTNMKALQSLPGVGHYTAAAIRNFAFTIPTPCLDTNIRRILHRVFYGPEHSDGTWQKDDSSLLILAEEVLGSALQKGDAANWHAALMDFGSLVCTKRSPKWDICPLTAKGLCKASYKTPSVIIPRKKKEPGRIVGSAYIPNRIFRGRIVEQLRDAPKGMADQTIGKEICMDWHKVEHNEWLQGLLKKLVKDKLITQKGSAYVLAE